MNAESPASNPRRAVSSVDVLMFVAAAGEAARRPIIASPFSVGPRGSATFAGPDRIWPPADSIIAVTQTVYPSYLLAWTWIVSGLPSRASLSASRIISPQVFGALGTRSLRYQRSWVLDVNGAP